MALKGPLPGAPRTRAYVIFNEVIHDFGGNFGPSKGFWKQFCGLYCGIPLEWRSAATSTRMIQI